MNRVQAGAFLVAAWLVVVALASTGSLAAGGGEGAMTPGAVGVDAAAAAPAAVESAVAADTVEFRITVYENTSARWRFTYTRILDNETERRRFEDFAEEFNRNETAAFRDFRKLARGLAASGRNATGREMHAVDFRREAYLGGACVTNNCGTVRMAFTWTNFAARRGDRLVVGDVFGTGLFLADHQQLVIVAGEGLAFESVTPDTYNNPDRPLAQRRSITYEGQMQFSDRRPRVVFVPAEMAGGTADGTRDGTADGRSPSRGAGGVPMALVGGLVVVLAGAGAAFVWWRGGGLPVGSSGAGGATADGDAVPGDPAVPDEELLTDEDRVLSLLEENGGRMKQVDIVDETGWSKSKVSMLLSDMEDDDQISKLRVGRENIISLSGHEPDAAGSPHEEE